MSELPDQVDTDRNKGLLDRFGIDVGDLIGSLGGTGGDGGGIAGRLGKAPGG